MSQIFTIRQKTFGLLNDGREATLYTLENAAGMSVSITNYGGIITSLWCPDKNGDAADVVLGFDSLAPYQTESPYFGALIGRVGNRIAAGRFTLDGKNYALDCNENNLNHLHGGIEGFDKKLWTATSRNTTEGAELHLSLVSPDGDQGYPGELTVEVVYRLTADNRLFTEYRATTNAPTLVNLTQHTYFNLAGTGDVLAHQLQLSASHYTPVNQALIPTGSVDTVTGTPMDFRTGKAIGQCINADNEQLHFAGGFDHNFVLDKKSGEGFFRAARVSDSASGRVLTLHTTEPGVQFYSGNFLDGSLCGKGRDFTRRSGFCLEPQHFPDAPNQPNFSPIVLRPGETYFSMMCFSFSVVG